MGIKFFWKQILLEAIFLEETLGASFGGQKFLGEIFACEISFGEENTDGEQKRFGEDIEGHGDQKCLDNHENTLIHASKLVDCAFKPP